MSMVGPVQSRCHEGSPVGKRNLRWEGLYTFRPAHLPGYVIPACIVRSATPSYRKSNNVPPNSSRSFKDIHR